MTKQEYLGLYAEGWAKGDLAKIIEATAPGYQFGDPAQGAIAKEKFSAYFDNFKKQVGQSGDVFMKIDGVIAYEVADHLIACCRWETTGQKMIGTGLISVGANGVEREDVVLL